MNILDAVGNTPLLKIEHLFDGRGAISIYAKAEFMNPSGSVKDRAAKAILLEALGSSRLKKGMTILDSTSGSTGIAYCMMGRYLGFDVLLCMPSNVSDERKKIIRSYGGRIIESDPLEGSEGAFELARSIAQKEPDKYFFPDQYSNPENYMAHYNTTACEIYEQTGGKITHFVAAAGTGGTFTGTSRRLKEYNSSIETVLVQPDSPFHGLEGLRYLKGSKIEGFFDPSLVDRQIDITTESAWSMVRQLSRDEGLLVGISSAANIIAALKVASDALDNSVIVTILADSGYRYLSEPVWTEFID